MRILVVDDMLQRHDVFVKLYGKKHLIIHAYSYEDAILEIKSNPYSFDVMFLDHDLSLESIMCNPYNTKEKTGTDLAKELVNILENPAQLSNKFTIICHSMNPAGAEAMDSIFKKNSLNSEIVPFNHVAKGAVMLSK